MKYKLLSLLFLILIINGYSQKYYPIVQETNDWSVVSGGCAAFLKVCCVKTIHYKFKGDTTIQSNNYKIILSSTDLINQNWEIIGFMREDTTQKKVWLRNLENKEGLIYNFDLTLGKEVTLFNPFFYDSNTYQVTKIDSIQLQSEYRKVYTLNIGDWKEQWIEGIGSKFGIVNCNIYGIGGGFFELLCFSNNEIEYVNPKFQTCHKTSFSPMITNQQFDIAYINHEYYYQITTSEIFDYDSISFFNWNLLPNGLHLNSKSGIISGIPIESGTFHQIICILNNGYVTDCLDKDLIVAYSTQINPIVYNNQIKIIQILQMIF